MDDLRHLDMIWWITAVELPALAGLFWMSWRFHRDASTAIQKTRLDCDGGLARVRESLSAYKLEVAKSYASLGHLKEVERRLTRHLLRIENKLDSHTRVPPAGLSDPPD